MARLVNSLKVRRSEHARERCGFRQPGCLTVWVGRLDIKKAGEGRVDEIKATFSHNYCSCSYTSWNTHALDITLSILVNCRIQVDMVINAVQYF